jgi:hypothetical protein
MDAGSQQWRGLQRSQKLLKLLSLKKTTTKGPRGACCCFFREKAQEQEQEQEQELRCEWIETLWP